MTQSNDDIPEWRQFERMVAKIEADARPIGLVVKSPDRIRSLVTGDLREVDASIRLQVAGSEEIITIECRKRSAKEDVTWIEQLATKKLALGAMRTIAVSSSGFSRQAQNAAAHYGIALRLVSEVTVTDINPHLALDFVIFNHKRCSIARVAFRLFRDSKCTVPAADEFDFEIGSEIDPFRNIFQNIDTGDRWSVNHLWHQVQQTCNPFSDIERGAPPVIRTACFPYPGNVTVQTSTAPARLGDVILSIALSIEVEKVTIEEANKVSYRGSGRTDLQRLEFQSTDCDQGEWSIALQAPRTVSSSDEVRTRLVSPDDKER